MKNQIATRGAALGLGTVSVLALVAGIAWAADGAGVLDATFGAGEEDGTPAGVVSTSLGNGNDAAEDLAVGADGAVAIVGNRHNGQSNDIVIVRYTNDGSLSTSDLYETLTLKVQNENTTVDPGDTQAVDLTITVPEKLNARTRYIGYAAISTQSVSFVVTPE